MSEISPHPFSISTLPSFSPPLLSILFIIPNRSKLFSLRSVVPTERCINGAMHRFGVFIALHFTRWFAYFSLRVLLWVKCMLINIFLRTYICVHAFRLASIKFCFCIFIIFIFMILIKSPVICLPRTASNILSPCINYVSSRSRCMLL